jgi:hypothetical protein
MKNKPIWARVGSYNKLCKYINKLLNCFCLTSTTCLIYPFFGREET